jgi:hypothetical protein
VSTVATAADAQASTPLPALLLPVRLETRFMSTAEGPQLWVRMYPDPIHTDTHEPELTEAEQSAGSQYWQNLTQDAKAAWIQLAAAFGPQRAAWIVQATNPQTTTPPGTRSGSWTRPALARALPAIWTVCLYDAAGSLTHLARTRQVRPGLALSPDPQATLPATGFAVDQPMRWLVDFQQAVEVGMAVQIPITAQEATVGFGRMLVYGVLDQPEPAAIQELLDAHHYTDGLAFVPQGAPTNNTAEATTPYSSTDPGFVHSYQVELGPPLTLGDAASVATLLGIDPATFSHIENADRNEQLNAFHMARALWPTTLGYYLRQMVPEIISLEQADEIRSYFIANVRARGMLPAFRVGPVPYGLLPVTSLALWNPPDADPLERALATLLRRLLPVWKQSSANTPRVGAGDPDAALTGILGMDASSRDFRVRFALGEDLLKNLAYFLTLDGPTVLSYGDQLAANGKATLAQLGYTNLDPTVVNIGLSPASYPVQVPNVQADPLSETDGLTGYTDASGQTSNYITWLATAPVDDIRNERYPGGAQPTSLLYALLRQATLQAYATSAVDVEVTSGALPTEARYEPELVNMDTANVTDTAWVALDKPVPGITAPGQPIKDYLYTLTNPVGTPFQSLGELRDSLNWLAALPSAELDRLLTETLDLFSHRLDAWITALANRLLSTQMAAPAGSSGVLIGGYGWAEQLTPEAQQPLVTGQLAQQIATLDQALPPIGQVTAAREALADNGGFIHAPSLAQAQTGAVLRSGYLSRQSWGNGQPLAIDLSSERVRTALGLIAGVRQGQPLGALLGYQLEQRLHDVDRDVYIQPLRNLFPPVANKLAQPSGPVESVAANSVIDGLALQRAWTSGSIDWAAPLPTPGSADQQTLIGLFGELDDALDALSDVSISESVYQIMRGNYQRAGGLLDAVTRGDSAPDPEVVLTPRTGTAITHRVELLVLGNLAPAWDWGQPGPNPRGSAEPILDAWVSGLLPNPANVQLSVTITDAGGTSQPPREITLDQLHLSPLDVLHLASAGTQPAASELEQRIVAAASADPSDTVAISYQLPPGSSSVSVPELIVCARAIRDLIGGARPLEPADLFVPEHQPVAVPDDLTTRAQDAIQAATDLYGQLTATGATGAALEAAIVLAGYYGIASALPVSATAPAAQAAAVAQVLHGRLAKASGAAPADAFTALFGETFTTLPAFSFGAGDTIDTAALEAALAASDSLLDPGDPLARERWVQQLSQVRPPMFRYDLAQGGAQLLGAARGELTLGQLPPLDPPPGPGDPPDRWLALDFKTAGDRVPTAGRVAFALQIVRDPPGSGYDPTLVHYGLMLDEWTERIPNTAETTAITFHYEEPTQRAPASALVAVSPTAGGTWDDRTLQAILNETLDLAAVRTVDLESVGLVGQLLPALYMPFNPSGDTVSLSEVIFE